MLRNGAEPGDVKQGMLGDCWLLGSFLNLATKPELLLNLIVFNGIEYGFAVFQFFKNGEWQHIIVDTRIPYNNATKTPLYGHCADPNEFWVPLMEKAYAKLHGCFEALNGGAMAQALVDLTGGCSEKYNLRAPETVEQIENGQFWKDLKKHHQLGYMIGCANAMKDTEGKQEDGMGTQGILYNHAYGMMDVRDIDGLQLVRIRNPWGHGEWTGRFADEDEAWDDYKGLKEKLNYNFSDDGTWWMRYDDWCANYNKIYVCKIFPSTWQ
jgi:calpain